MDSKNIFLDHLAQTSPHPLMLDIVSAEGTFVTDRSGKKYYDLISGIAVTNIGHRHPKVVEAVKRQVDQYMHVMAYGEFVQTPQNQLAKLLTDQLPDELNCCYFVNSGTEANEGALKLAKRVTGRTKIVSCNGSYHGSTHGSLSVSGNEGKKYAFRPLLPDVHFIEFNNHDDLMSIDTRTACVIIEPIQGDAGVRIPSIEYMQALRTRCNEAGALLIIDEIQTGFGRTGSLFAFEQFDIIPDILTMAKAMGGGMPIGAFVSGKKNMDLLTYDPMLGHITTFGGHPVNCAAGVANLEALVNEGILSNVESKGALIEQLLVHPAIKEIRRKGMMMAIEFESGELVQEIVHQCLENGVITFWFLSCPNSFRLAPPLTISEEEIRDSCDKILKAIQAVTQ